MARQIRSLAGKVVVITGGGRGIGAATAGALSRLGAVVAIGDLDVDVAKQTADRLDDAVALPLDVTDADRFTAFLDEVERTLGPIDILINNAGIMPIAVLDEEEDRTTRRLLEINLHAVIHGTREAVRRMKPRGTGHIVNIASVAGKAGFPGVATYCATKHGVVGLSEAVRAELRGTGVDISIVLPSIVRTELTAGVEDARFVKSIQPGTVAEAVVGALQRPRFEVYVPRSLGTINRFTRLLPRAAGEWIARAFKGDQVMMNAAHSTARADYEARAAASAPAVDGESGA
ncbi:MAG TPA: SDR family oxidoreductase [Actinophytocola sp.]|uniref:SDR family oxidoreductase n=1 Tax=Actinophytocola sp. TaxID=1872138 RepID=UPI002DB6BA52|nr:SDR family oxidoreductase [Actinophytocola sp.]HEU5475393.1 SDR family oxidoreductase [Actinophytocola sp.]